MKTDPDPKPDPASAPTTLTALLADVRADLGRCGPPPALPLQALAALPVPAPAPAVAGPAAAGQAAGGSALPLKWRVGLPSLLGLSGLAAALLVSVLLLAVAPWPPAAGRPHAEAGVFFPLAGALAPQPVWTVATEIPRERLALLGLPYDATRAGELVRAELLVDPRGEVLAVRPLD